ncbi:MAG TPA: PQQ-binding-like beta-propeller repeat protein [Solirubrobacteraceae bacterium]|nr:PQQ-binding-like beta-propeller repeat protein [Solirubrobacteraceae bacterium]
MPTATSTERSRPWRGIALAGLLLALLLATMMLFAAAAGASTSEAAWTTYHGDATRTGNDPQAISPQTPSLAWQSPNLGAPIWSQPLVVGSRVYVATVGDDVYALEAATGQIAWHASAGTPVPSSKLPCGDITPTVGIVGTPVIDPATGVLYAVADTWNGNQAQHVLEGFRLSTGEKVLSTVVDPPGADPMAILQRTALNLSGSNVVFGYGGNDGDCSVYKGAVVSVPESGAAPSYWQVPIAAPSTGGGAVWSTGGPVVDAVGNVFASTGNPNPPSGQEATTYDYSDSVVELNPALGLTGFFKPPTWQHDSNADLDLSSAAPELLPGGLVFQAGKTGVGYLIDESTLSSGAAEVFSGKVCAGAGSFGGDSYVAGVIYMPCTNGTQALAYNAAARTFTPLWQGPKDAFGPPIVSAGLVWDVASGGFSGGGTKLYGLEPASGKVRYTETLPSPAADHFASPSAGGGRVLVSTGSTVSAFQVGTVIASTAPGTGPGGTALPIGTTVHPPSTFGVLVKTKLRADRKGRVRVVLRCPPSTASCHGSVGLAALLTTHIGRGSHRRRATVRVALAHAAFGVRRDQFAVTLHLGKKARALLRRHHGKLHVSVTIALTNVSTQRVAASLSG